MISTSGAHTSTKTPPKKRRRLFLGLAVLVLVVAVCNPVTLAFVIRIGAAEAFEIQGPAMVPNYQEGDRVVVSKAVYGLFLPFNDRAVASWGEPQRGEVVIARSPADNVDVVKRIVAVGGDTIAMEDRVLVINGRPLARRVLGTVDIPIGGPAHCIEERNGNATYTVVEPVDGYPERLDPITLAAGHVFLMGDNRDFSNDSRNPRFGPVAIERIKGRVESHYYTASDRVTCPN